MKPGKYFTSSLNIAINFYDPKFETLQTLSFSNKHHSTRSFLLPLLFNLPEMKEKMRRLVKISSEKNCHFAKQIYGTTIKLKKKLISLVVSLVCFIERVRSHGERKRAFARCRRRRRLLCVPRSLCVI